MGGSSLTRGSREALDGRPTSALNKSGCDSEEDSYTHC